MVDLEKLTGFHADLTKQTTKLKNQLHRLFYEEDLAYQQQKGSPFSKKSLVVWLNRADYQYRRYQRLNCLVIKEKIKQLKQLVKIRQEIDQRIRVVIDHGQNKNILTLPGAGYATTANIITAVKGINRFRNINAFVK